jgi:U3 small nucleolar RNA-associated protein 20
LFLAWRCFRLRLLHSFGAYVLELHVYRRSGRWLGQHELRLFKLLLNYITDPLAAEHVVDLVLPFFSKKDLNAGKPLF